MSARPVPVRLWARLVREFTFPLLSLALLGLIAGLFETVFGVPHGQGTGFVAVYDRILLALFVFTSVLLVHRITCVFVLDGLITRARRRELPRIFKDFVGFGYGFVALVVALYLSVGEAWSSILALSGVVGVVVGLALRPIILDVFSGLSTNLESAFHIGDWISLEGADTTISGWVTQINWRTTHIRTRAGSVAVCPNSLLGTSVVMNHSRPYPLSRYSIRIKVPPEVAPEQVVPVLENALKATQDHPDGPSGGKKTDVLVTAVESSGVEYWLRFWIDPSRKSYDTAIDLVSRSVVRHLRMAGIPLAVEREQMVISKFDEQAADPTTVRGRARLLLGMELFRGVEAGALEQLAERMVRRPVRMGEVLCAEGDEDTEMSIVLEGLFEVTVTRDGETREAEALQPGDFFGEMALLTGEPRSATVTARTDGLLFQITRDALGPFLESHPDAMGLLSDNLARRRRRLRKLFAPEDAGPAPSESSLSSQFLERMRTIFRRAL